MTEEDLVELYKEFKNLKEQHNLTTISQRALQILLENDVLVADKVVTVQVDEYREYYHDYDHEDFISIKLFTEHQLKIVLEIGSRGLIRRWIEGVNNCECDNDCNCDCGY